MSRMDAHALAVQLGAGVKMVLEDRECPGFALLGILCCHGRRMTLDTPDILSHVFESCMSAKEHL